jgi:membrane protein YdbS with pleckstrin-like domain
MQLPQKDLRLEPATLVLRPDTSRVRLVKMCLVIMLSVLLSIVVGMFIYAGSNWWSLLGPTWSPVFIFLCLAICAIFALRVMVPFMIWSAKLRRSIYTVTREYVAVEADLGIFGRYDRMVPIAYISDVTTYSSAFQRFCKLGSIIVTSANGDSIILEDLAEAEDAREAIWRLVNQRAQGLEKYPRSKSGF